MSPRQRLCPITPQCSAEEPPPTPLEAPLLDSDGGKPATENPQQPTAIEVARGQHDIFNLVALLFVVWASLINWDFQKLLSGYGPAQAWSGQYFYENWATTVLYFIIDFLWVARVPNCVKSPGVILKHHIVAILYLSAPLAWPEYRWFMGCCLTVEINTWFLILRRVMYKNNVSPFLQDMVSTSFYLSWIAIRCFLYPAVLIIFLQMAHDKVLETSVLWHWPMMFIPIHFCLCLLNLKWSYDLFQPIIKRWMKADVEVPTVSSGL